MGRMLFKQPNGAYGIYSTISDVIVFYNITKENYTALSSEDFPECFVQAMYAGNGLHKLEDYIMPENWSEKALGDQVAILGEVEYTSKFINKIRHRWKKYQKEYNE